MNKIMTAIEKEFLHTPEKTLFGKFKNILFGAALYIIWATFIIWIYQNIIPEYKVLKHMSQSRHLSPIFTFIGMCVFAPLFEELIFRYPLSILRNISIDKVIIFFIIFSSVLFGFAHAGRDWSIPVQGVGGLIFCYVYIKNGYSYVSSVLMHFVINFYYFLI